MGIVIDAEEPQNEASTSGLFNGALLAGIRIE
jgi:hypothetical protein